MLVWVCNTFYKLNKIRMRYLMVILALMAIVSCKPSEKLGSKIIGKWYLEKVYEYGNDVTERHNPKNNRWIEFNKDGSFISDGDPFGRNTGRWKTDNENSVLHIDSNVDDDDSEWKVTFKDDQTSWTGIGHRRKENTRLIHKRKVDR